MIFGSSETLPTQFGDKKAPTRKGHNRTLI